MNEKVIKDNKWKRGKNAQHINGTTITIELIPSKANETCF